MCVLEILPSGGSDPLTFGSILWSPMPQTLEHFPIFLNTPSRSSGSELWVCLLFTVSTTSVLELKKKKKPGGDGTGL